MICFSANSDVYFDETLTRLGDSAHLNLRKRVLCFSKWARRRAMYSSAENLAENDEIYLNSLMLNFRIESQDAWIFQSPMSDKVVAAATFPLGSPRADNALTTLLIESGYSVENPSAIVRAIEVDTRGRSLRLYDPSAVISQKSSWVLFSTNFNYS